MTTSQTPRETVTCACAVCDGRQALVPVTILSECRTPTAIHNYVAISHQAPMLLRSKFIEAV